jgi:hypothetical protein
MKEKIFPRAVAYAGCAIFALTTSALAQNSGPTVEVTHDSKDSKAIPITQEKEPVAQFLLDTGYLSEYNFRGTNLMPNSDGAYFYEAQATIPKVGPGSLTLGVWAIHQIGTASANSWSISEGGGGAGISRAAVQEVDPNGVPTGRFINADRFPTTTQTTFREIDIFTSYRFSLGPIDVTFGNVAFLIHREAQTFELDALPVGFHWTNPPIIPFSRFATFGPLPTVQDEQFDRLYIRLSTTKLCPHLIPSIIYYQTIYSEGDQPTRPGQFITTLTQFGDKILIQSPGLERNDELGGYLEGRLAGNFPVGHWVDINPYGVIAVSFRDRSEPVAGTFGGRPFTGFNHAQAGLELAFHLTPHIDFVPQVVYSHHISEPPIGTDKNEFWGGVKVAVSLW